jgi:hypothetical protein
MVRRDGAEIRKERMEELARFIQRSLRNSEAISLSITIKSFAYQHGLRPERVMEYLEILEGLGQFTIDREHDLIKKVKISNE